MTTTKMRIGDTAAMLGVHPATVRNWLKLGDEFFSSNATKTTGKRFTPQDIEQLKRIQSLLDEGFRYEDIPARLPVPEVFEVIEDTPPEAPGPSQTNANAMQPTEYLERFQAILEQQHETHQEAIRAKDETIQVLKDENERLRADLERARRPWWKR